jgi:hypothetical protein
MTIPAGHVARVTCYADNTRSFILEDNAADLQSALKGRGVVMTDTEFRWIEEHGGAENDHWLVRIVEKSEPYMEGVEVF